MDPSRGASGISIFGVLLLFFAFLLWMFFAACAGSLRGSDAAGNGLTQGFAMLSGIVLWIALAVLLIVAGVRGGIPRSAAIAAMVLVPASAAASLSVVQTLSSDFVRIKWPLVVPIAAPLLILLYAAWALFPLLRSAIPAQAAGGILWGAVLILSVIPWPAIRSESRDSRQRIAKLQAEAQALEDKEQQQRTSKEAEEWSARFEKLPSDATLFQLSEFTRHGDDLRTKALDRIHKLSTRQNEAEDMLARGVGWPLLEVRNLNLEAAPSFCEQARKFLAACAKAISPPVPGRPYDWEKGRLDPYLPALEWLLEQHCDCSGEVAALESALRAYPPAADRDRTLATLSRLHRGRRP